MHEVYWQDWQVLHEELLPLPSRTLPRGVGGATSDEEFQRVQRFCARFLVKGCSSLPDHAIDLLLEKIDLNHGGPWCSATEDISKVEFRAGNYEDCEHVKFFFRDGTSDTIRFYPDD